MTSLQTSSDVPSNWICGKVLSNFTAWIEPKRYTRDDLAVGVYTGERVYYSRGAAARDTWLAQIPASVLYGPTSNPDVPVQGFGLSPDYLDPRATQRVQLYGLRDLYRQFPNKKWYFIVGCDTYLNVDYALRMLSAYDAEKPYWVSKTAYPRKKFPALVNGSSALTYTWSSGAWGWFLSQSVAKAFADSVDHFIATTPIDAICYCPDKLTGMLLSLLGYNLTTMDPYWGQGYDACAVDSKASRAARVPEWSLYHYVTPRKMLAIHHRVMHERLDRFTPKDVDDHQKRFVKEHALVVKRRNHDIRVLGGHRSFTAEFVTPTFRTQIEEHFEMLREAQVAVRSLADTAVYQFRPYDIPSCLQWCRREVDFDQNGVVDLAETVEAPQYVWTFLVDVKGPLTCAVLCTMTA